MKVLTERPQIVQPRADSLDDYSGISAQKVESVDYERKAVLYLPDGRVLCRRAGF